jgi:hypothetical protein
MFMSKKAKKILFISLGVIGVAAIALVVWMKQPAEITKEDIKKAEEVAADPELDALINDAASGEETDTTAQ